MIKILSFVVIIVAIILWMGGYRGPLDSTYTDERSSDINHYDLQHLQDVKHRKIPPSPKCQDKLYKSLQKMKVYNTTFPPLNTSDDASSKYTSYLKSNFSVSKMDFKILFVLVIHDIKRFEVIWKSIYNSKDYFIIHYDRKKHETAFAQYPNVFLYSYRHVTWGGYSQVQVTLDSMKIASILWKDWKYFVNLSLMDYPLVPIETIKHELQKTAAYFGTWSLNYMEYNIPSDPIMHGFEECDGYMYSLFWFDPPIPTTNFWSGSSWFILSHDFIKWIMTDKEVVPYWKEIMKRVPFCDETFFQTIIHYSPFKSSLIPENHRFVTWETSQLKCYHDVLGDLCGRHPELLVKDQLSSIFVNPQKFFTRKIEDEKIIQEIEKRRHLPRFKGIKKNLQLGERCLALDSFSDSCDPNDETISWTVGPCSAPLQNCQDFDTKETCVIQKQGKCLESKHDRVQETLRLEECHFGVSQHFKFSNCTIQKKGVNIPPLCINKDLKLNACKSDMVYLKLAN